jgi:hypothetical protein
VNLQELKQFVPSKQGHHFVPYTEVDAVEIPKILDIAQHHKRIYLKPQPVKSVAVKRREQESLSKGLDSKRVLDLGVAPLQRIINEMKSVSSGTADEGPDRSAVARASGLAGYCNFLTGSGGGGGSGGIGGSDSETKASPRALRNPKNTQIRTTF